MNKSWFTLVPEWVMFDEFWSEIHERNKWLIYLRYGSTAMLFLMIGLSFIFTSFKFHQTPLAIICGIMLIYNIILHKLWLVYPKVQEKYPKFNNIYFSFFQICVDFISLMALIYYTGGVESPLIYFFYFNIIIGALLLPGRIVSMIITVTLFLSIIGAVLEYKGLLPHKGLGLINSDLYDDKNYITLLFLFLSISLYTSNYIANSIAKKLYQREKSLREAFHQIDEAEKSKLRYAMTVVHDLKTPISAAMTYLNMLLDGTLGKMKPEHYRPIERTKIRLNDSIKTINDVLQISQLKIESSREKYREINLFKLFDEIYSDVAVMAASKHVGYYFETNTKNDIFINAPPKLLKFGLSNLVTNAFKYTEEGGTIEIKVNDNPDYIEISVADDGIGIPENEQKKIFNDFYRSSISKKKGIEGTGLGMSIVQQFVNLLDGTIEVLSPSYLSNGNGRIGTNFVIKLPKKVYKD